MCWTTGNNLCGLKLLHSLHCYSSNLNSCLWAALTRSGQQQAPHHLKYRWLQCKQTWSVAGIVVNSCAATGQRTKKDFVYSLPLALQLLKILSTYFPFVVLSNQPEWSWWSLPRTIVLLFLPQSRNFLRSCATLPHLYSANFSWTALFCPQWSELEPPLVLLCCLWTVWWASSYCRQRRHLWVFRSSTV